MVDQNELIGTWKIEVPSGAYGDVAMSFDKGGGLRYSTHENDKEQIIILSYRLEGEVLVTDQPSAPRQERTRVVIEGDRMTLDYNGKISTYRRLL